MPESPLFIGVFRHLYLLELSKTGYYHNPIDSALNTLINSPKIHNYRYTRDQSSP